jgi:uncharacterized protein (TIGR02246 family)
MKNVMLAICLAAAIAGAGAQSTDGASTSAAIGGVLDAWHAAAAAADEEKYFSYFAPEAVFLGTDATERWTRDEFRKFAHPYFAKGNAWSFRSVARSITTAPDHKVAWFDEALETPNLGPCRGSGVVVATNAGWKIAQYNLSIPIPNDLVDEFKARIENKRK